MPSLTYQQIADRRELFFHLPQPLTLTIPEWEAVWPALSNVWSSSAGARKDNDGRLRSQYCSCFFQKRAERKPARSKSAAAQENPTADGEQPSADQTPPSQPSAFADAPTQPAPQPTFSTPTTKRKRETHTHPIRDNNPCQLRIRVDFDYAVGLVHVRRTTDHMHTHTIQDVDEIKRSDLVRTVMDKEVAKKGKKSYIEIHDAVMEIFGDAAERLGAGFISAKDVQNTKRMKAKAGVPDEDEDEDDGGGNDVNLNDVRT
ncbi:hypothetical protein HK097_005704, partial [Rhizophlyctis rosea]